MLRMIIHIIWIKTSTVYHWKGKRFLKWVFILGGEKSNYNYLPTPWHPLFPRGQQDEKNFKDSLKNTDKVHDKESRKTKFWASTKHCSNSI